MKRILMVVLGLFFSVSLFSQTISSTSVEVCDTRYQCYGGSGTSPDFEGTNLGNISALEFNGGLSVSSNWGASTASMYYRIDGGEWKVVVLDKKVVISDGGGDARSPIFDPNENPIVNINSLAKTLGDVTSYSRNTDYSVSTSVLTNGSSYTLDIVHAVSGTTMPADTSLADYSATFTKIADVEFTDGTAFTPAITTGNSDELIGRFQLQADVTGANLTDAAIDLSGIRSGFSNLKLWASTDASYDVGDTQLGSTIAIDPQASTAEFSSFSMAIPTSGTYILLTADVAEDATGSIQGVIGEVADLTVTDGEINSTISMAYMSNGGAEIPTSIELTTFNAKVVKGKVELTWTTESESENSHFLVYRDGKVIAQVEGAGTTSETNEYAYSDVNVLPGVHEYALADVTYGGVEELHDAVTIELGARVEAAEFTLNNAYPNPFNPRTAISYRLSAVSNIDLSIYNSAGEKVTTLFSGEQSAGQHQLLWNAANHPSGIYFVKMQVGEIMQTQKLVLMK